MLPRQLPEVLSLSCKATEDFRLIPANEDGGLQSQVKRGDFCKPLTWGSFLTHGDDVHVAVSGQEAGLSAGLLLQMREERTL